MKLHILSDLHLEFSNLLAHQTTADVVILAGDIGTGTIGIEWARKTFPRKKIVYVAGNHEFYGQDRLETITKLRVAAQESGAFFLDNDEVLIDGVRFLGCTLWTDFALFGKDSKSTAMREGNQCLNDFRLIREGKSPFSPMDSIKLHQKSLKWLQRKLARPFSGKTVVVTHHLPSERSVPTRFKKNIISACFASRLEHLFDLPVNLWIHGHTHDNMDYEMTGTRVVCNPRGYVRFGYPPENLDFNPGLVIEI
jgi:predicted phosphodiesterase